MGSITSARTHRRLPLPPEYYCRDCDKLLTEANVSPLHKRLCRKCDYHRSPRTGLFAELTQRQAEVFVKLHDDDQEF